MSETNDYAEIEFEPEEQSEAEKLEAIRAAKARAERDAEAWANRATAEWQESLNGILGLAKREFDAWQAFACKGLNAADCSDDNAQGCERFTEHPRGGEPRCPRRRLEWQAKEAERAKQRERRRHEERGIPDRVLANVFDHTPDETDAVKLLGEALRAKFWCIVLASSEPGVGKTTAAGLECIRHKGRLIGVRDLARLSPYEHAGELASLGRTGFLVVDDIGREYLDAKGFFQGNFEDLVDVRYRSRLSTVITTNLGPKDFTARYGARVVDRILEGGKFTAVPGKSLRRRGA